MAFEATGDPEQCRYCGGYHYFVQCEESKMSMRPKTPVLPRPRYEPESLPDLENTADLQGAQADLETLTKFLTGYMGDQVFAKRFAACIDLIKRKNADYSQGEQKGDRIAAFRRMAKDINLRMEQVWAVFAQKHWGAVMKFIKDGKVESEPIGERVNDLINYFVLLGAILDDRGDK